MTPQKIMRRAAAMLETDAFDEQASCSVGQEAWACQGCKKDADGKCQAQRNVEERRQVAAGLLVMAKALYA